MKPFPTHANEEERKAIQREIADAPRRTADQLRHLRDMQRERVVAMEKLEAQIAQGPKHSYGENCPACFAAGVGPYCLAFPNWSKK